MAQRRRTRWIDSLLTSRTALAGAAAPGTIIDSVLMTETEIESLGDGATLIRIVGDIWTCDSAGDPVVSHNIWLSPAYAGIVLIADWEQDAYERTSMLGTWMVVPDSNTALCKHTRVDLRSKRKLSPGTQLTLSSQNYAIANNDATISFHLRMLLLLP